MTTPQQRIPVPPPVEFDVNRLDMGLVLDVDNRDAPVESATVAELVRFENRGVRKDYGRTNLGTAAAGRVIGLVEHRNFLHSVVSHQLVRLVRLTTDDSLSLQVWDGDSWEEAATYPIIEDAYLSLVSMHNLLIMADGRRVLKWEEVPVLEDQFHEFAADLFLSPGGTTETPAVTITPAGAHGDRYVIRFSTLFRQEEMSPASVRVIISMRDDPDADWLVVGVRDIEFEAIGSPPPEVEVEHEMEIFEELVDGNQIKLSIEGEAGELVDVEEDFGPAASGANPNGPPQDPKFYEVYYEPFDVDVWGLHWVPGDLTAETEIEVRNDDDPPDGTQLVPGMPLAAGVRRWPGDESYPSSFEYRWYVRHKKGVNYSDWVEALAGVVSAGTIEDPLWVAEKTWAGDEPIRIIFDITISTEDDTIIGFYKKDGGVWSLVDTDIWENLFAFDLEYTGIVKDLTIAGLSIGDFYGVKLHSTPPRGDILPIRVESQSSGSDYDVHPFNFNDGDPEHGISYQLDTGDVESEINLLGGNPPRARIIAPFADRLIALQDGRDAQVLAASADGDVEDWEGVDTFRASLSDTLLDPIDDLMGLAHLAPGVAALFRKRSIFRVAETGNVDLPIVNVKWVDYLGTESPFSIQTVEGGIAFLGHDKLVYILSEQGPRPVSMFVHDEMIEKLSDSALALVDSAYEPVAGEYFLAIPTNGSAFCTEIWIFDVKAYWLSDAQIMPWRKITTNVERLGSITEIPS